MKAASFFKLALVAALVCAGLAAQAQTRIRFAHAGPETASQHLAALEFARLVKERSKGQLEVQVYPSSQLGNDSTVLGAVRGGTIDMMMAGSGNFSGLASGSKCWTSLSSFATPRTPTPQRTARWASAS